MLFLLAPCPLASLHLWLLHMKPVSPCTEPTMSYLVTQFITVSPLSPKTTWAPSPRRWSPAGLAGAGGRAPFSPLPPPAALGEPHSQSLQNRPSNLCRHSHHQVDAEQLSRCPEPRLSRQDSRAEPRLWVLSASLAMSIMSIGHGHPSQEPGPATCRQKGSPGLTGQGMGGPGGGQEGAE